MRTRLLKLKLAWWSKIESSRSILAYIADVLTLYANFSAEFSFVRVEWPRLIERGVVSRSDYDAMMRSAQPNYAIIDG